jgi:Ser/Thr protein kinase RdoA (MazF antagonist)
VKTMYQSVLPAYGLDENSLTLQSFGSGLINNTWKVTTGDREYILQKVNNKVFERPHTIAYNVRLIADYLRIHSPEYCFIAPLTSKEGDEMVYLKGEGFYRLFPFVPDSHTYDVAETPEQAYEAAVQFGRFTSLLSAMESKQLKTTIPFFHDLNHRYGQFLDALKNGNQRRKAESNELVQFLMQHTDIVATYRDIVTNPEFKLRVTHHDTKISNVLFNADGKGLCVIDLDTVMPGHFISDVGDMMRTYLCPVSEEEQDLSKIVVREEYYKAIVSGYYSEMKEQLTQTEKHYFFYAGKFMIYMQALRFLTDHLNNDRYYGAKYPGHNLVRATNQVTLLSALIDKQHVLVRMI